MKNKIFFVFTFIFIFYFFIKVEATTLNPVLPQPKPALPVQTVTPVVNVSTNFSTCVRSYNTSVENLFYLTLAAINANNFKIDEIQSRTGYVSFLVNNKLFLVSITSVNNKASMIKITPADNSYNFSPVIVERIFGYLTGNIK